MSSVSRATGSPPQTVPRWKRVAQWLLPVLVSAAMIGWLLASTDLDELGQALVSLPWQWLVPLTAVMVVALYLWDTVCLQLVYVVRGRYLPYRRMLHVRGLSYLVGAFNYEAGQGMVAWNIARLQATRVLTALSRSVLLAYHDIAVLLSLGLVGSLFSDVPQVEGTRWFCAIGLGLLAAVAIVYRLLPARWRWKFRHTRWGEWIHSWNWGRSAGLILARLVYFGILIAYAAGGLWICRLDIDRSVVFSGIPLVVLADGLPSVTGLGVRENALRLLLNPPNPAVLLAFSLLWSSGMILGRVIIALVHLWASGLGAAKMEYRWDL